MQFKLGTKVPRILHNLTLERGVKKQIIMRMQILSLFWLFGCMHVAAEGFSQEIDLNAKNLTLPQIFEQIEKQTDYRFFYDNLEMKQIGQISIMLQALPVEEALKRISNDIPIIYTIVDKTIVVKPEPLTESVFLLQEREIAGVVRMENGEPLPGVSVTVKGVDKGTVTDANGRFKLVITEGNTLIFSSLGFIKKEVIITDQTTLDLILMETAMGLNDVVVTGYNEVEKRKLTSAITTVEMADIPAKSSMSIDKLLQGQIPGVSIISNSGEVGSVAIVKIRGTSTLTGNAQPLWVVDGVILEDPVPLTPAEINTPDVVNRIGNAVSFLNPQDIESITVLKDASATAIYGVKAAGGVVVITTKKGFIGKPLVNFSSNLSVSVKPNYDRFDLMNSKERIAIEEYYLNSEQTYNNADANIHSVGLAGAYARYKNKDLETWEEYQNAVRKAQTYNTDWFDVLFRNGVSSNSNINISGGSEKTIYYATFSALEQQGEDIQTDNNRYNGSIKVNTQFSPRVNTELFLSGYTAKRSSYPFSLIPVGISTFTRSTPRPFDYAINTSRTFPLYNEDGSYYMYRGHNDFYLFNVMNEYNESDQVTKNNGFSGRASVDVKLGKQFKLFGLFNYSVTNTLNETYYTDKSNQIAGVRRSEYGIPAPDDSVLPSGGVIFSNSNFQNYYMARLALEYRPVQTQKQQLELYGGGEYRVNTYRGDNTTGWGYLHDRGRTVATPENMAENLASYPYLRIVDYDRKYASYYGVATYTLNQKYTVNGNIRVDGSNLFGSNPKYRWKPAWSISGRWNVKQEGWLSEVETVNSLAFRASYGVQGAVNEQSTPQIIATFTSPSYWSELNQLRIDQPANPDLRWEKTYSWNTGMDFALFNNRINGAVDVYSRKSKDLIINTRISEINGFSYLPINFADVSNKGVEFGLTVKPIANDAFMWASTFNFSYNRNKVLRVNLEQNVSRMLSAFSYKPDAAMVGKPLSSLYSVDFVMVDPATGIARYQLANGDTTSARSGLEFGVEDIVYNGPIEAPYTGGFSNLFSYKNFKATILFTYGMGNTIRMSSILSAWMYSPDQNMPKELNGAWMQPGDETDIPKILTETGSNNHKTYWNQSDIRVMKGDYLRLKNVTLQYYLPQPFLNKLGLSKTYLQLEGNNLFLWASKGLHGFDPETISYAALPNLTSFLFGVNVTF